MGEWNKGGGREGGREGVRDGREGGREGEREMGRLTHLHGLVLGEHPDVISCSPRGIGDHVGDNESHVRLRLTLQAHTQGAGEGENQALLIGDDTVMVQQPHLQ